MAVIKITEFGGITPSRDERNLSPSGAKIAKNMDTRWGDFRPLRGAGASVTTVPSGTISVHRTPSGTWLSSTTDTNFVNGQVASASVERVYLTGRSAYPEAWQSGSYRRLGVPAPVSAPTAVVDATTQFSTDDRSLALRAIADSMYATSVAERSEYALGGGVPASPLSPGAIWLAHGDNPDLPTTLWRQVCYCVPITLGPVATVTASDAYLLDPALGGKAIVEATVDYWAVPFYWQARGYSFDEAAMSTAFQLLDKPPENTSPLFTAGEADAVAALIAGPFDATVDPASAYVEALDDAQNVVINILASGSTDPLRSYALANAQSTLRSASQRVEDFYTEQNRLLRSKAEASLGVYDGNVQAAVERELETRFYRHTYVTDWGEESAPSDPSTIATLDQNDTVDVSISAPGVTSPYGTITHWRLYRSSTTNTGQSWQFVAEIAIGTTTYNDALAQEELQDVLATETWTEPRADLFALTAMHNGILAGLADDGRVVCFCEPEHPYAWPREYELPLQFRGVALGIFGQTLVVLTEGLPYYVSGADSASMSAQEIESAQACISKRSVVSADGGVIYASPDGICVAGPAGVQLITVAAFSREDWQALGLTTSFAAFSEGVYRIVTEN